MYFGLLEQVVDAVHAKGSFIYVQLWATGRAAFPQVLESEGLEYVAPSAIRLTDFDAIPRALTITGLYHPLFVLNLQCTDRDLMNTTQR